MNISITQEEKLIHMSITDICLHRDDDSRQQVAASSSFSKRYINDCKRIGNLNHHRLIERRHTDGDSIQNVPAGTVEMGMNYMFLCSNRVITEGIGHNILSKRS